jgi:hypothetical protein
MWKRPQIQGLLRKSLGLGRAICPRKKYREDCFRVQLAFDCYPAAVRLDNGLDDCEAEAAMVPAIGS